MEVKTVKIPSISCHHCINNIKRELLGIEGIVSVEGDPNTKELKISWSSPATWDTISAILDETGYSPEN